MRKRILRRALILIGLVMLTGCTSIQTQASSCQQLWANTFVGVNSRIPQQELKALLAFDRATQGGIVPAAQGTFPCKSVPPPCQWPGVTCASGHVTKLDLSYRQLPGEIPPELGNLSQLHTLYLQGNQLSGEIPPELGNLSHLRRLNLQGNQLSGEVPAELGSISQLRFLVLYNNRLSGPLPDEVTELFTLSAVYLFDTELCIPQTAEFEAWVAGLDDFYKVPFCE